MKKLFLMYVVILAINAPLFALGIEQDIKYEKIKKRLINAVEENQSLEQIRNILSHLTLYLFKPLQNVENVIQDEEVQKNYITRLSDYLGDLLSEPIKIATNKKRHAINFVLLSQLRPLDFFKNNLKVIQPTITLNNQPINALIDRMAIRQIGKYYMKKKNYLVTNELVDFLKHLVAIGLTQQRLQNILARAMLIYQPNLLYKSKKFTKHFIETLREQKIIDYNLDDELKHEKPVADLILVIKKRPLTDAYVILNTLEFNINGIDINGDTPLILAISKSNSVAHLKLAIFLIEKVDVDKSGQAGMTPLMHAIKVQNIEIILSLLNKGADTGLKDIFDKTALDYAQETKNKEIIDIIQAATTTTSDSSLSLKQQLTSLNLLGSTLINLTTKTGITFS